MCREGDITDSRQTPRYFIDAYGVNDEALREGFKWLQEQAQTGMHTDMALVVNGINNIKNAAGVLGTEAAAMLARNRKLDIGMHTSTPTR